MQFDIEQIQTIGDRLRCLAHLHTTLSELAAEHTELMEKRDIALEKHARFALRNKKVSRAIELNNEPPKKKRGVGEKYSVKRILEMEVRMASVDGEVNGLLGLVMGMENSNDKFREV